MTSHDDAARGEGTTRTPKQVDPPARGTGESDPFNLISGGEGIITGTVVCAAVIAAGAGHFDSTAQLSLAILGTVFVYWLAHLHARTLGKAVAHRHHPLAALKDAAAHTWPVATASLLPVGILFVAELAGAELDTAAWIALWATIALLAGYSFLAGRRGGLGMWGSVASAAAGAAVGVFVVLLKTALH